MFVSSLYKKRQIDINYIFIFNRIFNNYFIFFKNQFKNLIFMFLKGMML